MTYTVNWTKKAERTFDQNIDYLEQEWNPNVVNQFLERVDTVISIIETNPFSYPLYPSSNDIRKCVVHERIILFYKIFDDTNIDILIFWNTYKNPTDLKL